MELRLIAKGTIMGAIPFKWTVDIPGSEGPIAIAMGLIGTQKIKAGALNGTLQAVAHFPPKK